jgi:hypothetical protein
MSCMVIDEDSLIGAARTIYASKYNPHLFHSHYLEKLHDKIIYWGKNEFLDNALSNLTRLAFIINHKAYRERYQRHKDARFASPHKIPKVSSRKFETASELKSALFQALKTIDFIDYQCLDVSRADKLKYQLFFERLAEARQLLAYALIENDDLYKFSNWS